MADDPFSQYQNAFQSIVPPQGVVVQPSAPIEISPNQVASDKYDRFLIDQGINPNTIGTATIDQSTGQMVVPTIAQEQAAVSANNQANARQGDLIRAANWAAQRGQGDKFLEYKDAIRKMNNQRGGENYSSRLAYFLAMANPTPTANGFSG